MQDIALVCTRGFADVLTLARQNRADPYALHVPASPWPRLLPAHRRIEARIVDIDGRNGAEYMTLETGESVRLDRIVSVDGVRLATFPGDGSTAPDD